MTNDTLAIVVALAGVTVALANISIQLWRISDTLGGLAERVEVHGEDEDDEG